MKDKEMIEEMANDLEEEFVLCGTLSNCGTKRCSRCFSKYLYEQNYRKLPKDSVVLLREEYYELKQAKKLLEIKNEEINNLADANIRYSIALENKSKETAEKYRVAMMLSIQEMQKYLEITEEQAKLLYYHNYQVAKQFDVEIKEDKKC